MHSVVRLLYCENMTTTALFRRICFGFSEFGDLYWFMTKLISMPFLNVSSLSIWCVHDFHQGVYMFGWRHRHHQTDSIISDVGFFLILSLSILFENETPVFSGLVLKRCSIRAGHLCGFTKFCFQFICRNIQCSLFINFRFVFKATLRNRRRRGLITSTALTHCSV